MDLANTSASVKQVADFSDGAAISTINDEDRVCVCVCVCV